MQTTYRRIAVKFNRRNRAEFEQLARAGRLSHITFCTPTGRMESQTVTGALAIVRAGRNVYADVTELAAGGCRAADDATVASYISEGLGE